MLRPQLRAYFEEMDRMAAKTARKPESNPKSEPLGLLDEVGDRPESKALAEAIKNRWPGTFEDLYRASDVSQGSFRASLRRGVTRRGYPNLRKIASTLGIKWESLLIGEVVLLGLEDLQDTKEFQQLARLLRSPKAPTVRDFLNMADQSLVGEHR